MEVYCSKEGNYNFYKKKLEGDVVNGYKQDDV